MPSVTYIEHDGTAHTAEVKLGLSVMEGAVNNSVPGIDADCGGACACATCHVYVDPDWTDRTGEANAQEKSMLSFAQAGAPESPLSSHVRTTAALGRVGLRRPGGL